MAVSDLLIIDRRFEQSSSLEEECLVCISRKLRKPQLKDNLCLNCGKERRTVTKQTPLKEMFEPDPEFSHISLNEMSITVYWNDTGQTTVLK